MQRNKKIAGLILACLTLFGLGMGARWLLQRQPERETTLVQAADAATAVPTVKPTVQNTPVPAEIGKPTPTVDLAMDFKRDAILNDGIRAMLPLVHEQTVSGVTLRVSDMVYYDARAFVRVCIDARELDEPLDSGMPFLIAKEGEWSDSYVNDYYEPPTKEYGRCVIFELISVPYIHSESVQFRIDFVGYLPPDEGRMCETYLKRAEKDDRLAQVGVEIECVEEGGTANVKIAKNANQLSEGYINDLMNEVISGVRKGPWEFELKTLWYKP